MTTSPRPVDMSYRPPGKKSKAAEKRPILPMQRNRSRRMTSSMRPVANRFRQAIHPPGHPDGRRTSVTVPIGRLTGFGSNSAPRTPAIVPRPSSTVSRTNPVASNRCQFLLTGDRLIALTEPFFLSCLLKESSTFTAIPSKFGTVIVGGELYPEPPRVTTNRVIFPFSMSA